MHKERIALADVVHSAINSNRPRGEQASHKLDVHLPPEPLDVEADPASLAAMFTDLLDKAARRAHPGGVISLDVYREGDNAVVSVRHDAAATMPAPGVPAVGGEPSGREPAGERGAEYMVRLPLAQHAAMSACTGTSTTASAMPAQAAQDAQGAARTRILVVDDNRDAAESLVMLLEVLGAEVFAVHDGAAALEILPDYRPDLVLLDIGMPGMDGYEVAQRIRRLPDLGDIRLVALTGWGLDEDRRRTEESGFDRHLTKPADLAVLRALLSVQ